MSTLTSRTIADSYPELIKVDSAYSAPDTLRQVEDGVGNTLPLRISQTSVFVTGSLLLNNALTQAYPINSTWGGETAAISVASALTSSSPTTGALIVAGGVGIGSNLYVGSNLNVLGASTFSGSSQFLGNVNIDGQLTLKGNIAVGDANTDTISFTADVTSNFLPDATETYDLGASGRAWHNVFSKGLVSKTIDISERATLSPVAGDALVTISPTNLTIAPTGATSNLNNVTIGATTPRNASFTSITQTDLAGSVALSSTVDSTTPSTGSLKTSGGAGIAKNLYVGGTLNVASTGSNNVTFTPPVNVNNVSTFTNTLTINPPNTTAAPLRIANNNVDAVTVDTAGQLNVLKTSVYTGKATFNGVTEVNNVLQQVNAGSTSTFAGSLTLNNPTTGLTVNGPAVFRGFTAKNVAGALTTLTYAHDTGDLSTSRFVGTSALSIGTGATTTAGSFFVNSTGYFNANDGASISAGASNSGSIVIAGAPTGAGPAPDTRFLRIRKSANSGSDIATIDLGSGDIEVTKQINFSSPLGSFISSLIPFRTNEFDLGSKTLGKNFRNLYLTNDIELGGRLYATKAAGVGLDHTIVGNLTVNGLLTTTAVSSQTTSSQVSTGKTLTLAVGVNDLAARKVVQTMANTGAAGGGIVLSATFPYTSLNTTAAAFGATETITHDLGIQANTVTAIFTSNGVDASNYFTFTQTGTNQVAIAWKSAATLATLGLNALGTAVAPISIAAGGVLFTLTPSNTYGYAGLNVLPATTGGAVTSETVTHNLQTTAVKVTITLEESGALIPTTSYTTSSTTTQTTITWVTGQAPTGPNLYRIVVEPTAVVQKTATITYTTPSISLYPNTPEGVWSSSENFSIPSSKAYFVGSSRVLSADTLGSGVTKSSLTRVGIISGGNANTNVWQGNTIQGAYGGTGAANSGKIISVTGNFTLSGGFDTTLTTTAATSLTLPTTGTLATLAGSEQFSNKTFSSGITFNSGALTTPLGVNNGGTGRNTLLANNLLFGNGTNAVSLVSAGTDKQVLVSNAGVPTFSTLSPVITLTGDVTGTGTMTDLGNVSINTTVSANNVALGTDTTGSYVESFALTGSGLTVTNAAPGADGAQYTVTSNATALNNPSTIVLRDASGNFSAGEITATSFVGNASTASSAAQWTTARTLTLSGDISGTVSINGANDATMSNTAIVAGSILNADINANANIADTKLAQIVTANKVANSATTAQSCTGVSDPASASLANSIVSRDAAGSVTVNQIVALQGIIGTASDVLDGVSTQKVKVSGFNSTGQAVSSEQTEIVFSSNSNCNVWVSPDASGTKTNVQVFVPDVTSFVNDFNDANFLISDDASGGRIKFKLDSLSSASSAGSGTPRELIVADASQTLLGYTNAAQIGGTPGTLTTYPFQKWDVAPLALQIKIAGTTSGDAPVTAYIPFYQ